MNRFKLFGYLSIEVFPATYVAKTHQSEPSG